MSAHSPAPRLGKRTTMAWGGLTLQSLQITELSPALHCRSLPARRAFPKEEASSSEWAPAQNYQACDLFPGRQDVCGCCRCSAAAGMLPSSLAPVPSLSSESCVC